MHPTTIILAVAILAGLPTPAWASRSEPTEFAQNTSGFHDTINGRRLEDAPVSSLRTPGVSPTDRAGTAGSATARTGPVDSTPFSGTPDSERGEGGQADRVDPADGTASPLPNLDQ